MRCELHCVACGMHTVDFDECQSVVLLAPNMALVQFICPGCGTKLSATIRLSGEILQNVNKRFYTDGSQPLPHTEPGQTRGRYDKKTIPDQYKLSYSAGLSVEEDNLTSEAERPLIAYADDLKAVLDDFRVQIESLGTVDAIIEEIGKGHHRERSDV